MVRRQSIVEKFNSLQVEFSNSEEVRKRFGQSADFSIHVDTLLSVSTRILMGSSTCKYRIEIADLTYQNWAELRREDRWFAVSK